MTWTAFIDGGSRGNPGPAAGGVHIRDEHNATVFAGGFFFGRMTNNQAEYRALLAALDLLTGAGADSIEVSSDSELMVRHIAGEYRVKSADLRPLFEEAKRKLERFDRSNLRYVPRVQNRQADKLANKAMDAARDVVLTDKLGLVRRRAVSPEPRRPARKAASGLVVEAQVKRGPGKSNCPAGVRKGQTFVFTEVTPAGLCIEACASLVDAVRSVREVGLESDASMTCSCPKADCGAVFEVRCGQEG